MNNEYLRLDNPDAKVDSTVNKYSAKTQVKRKAKKQELTSTIDLILEEVYESQNTTTLINQETVHKPKILDTIVFSFIFLIAIIFLGIVTRLSTSLLLTFILSVSSAFFIPVSFIYFFHRLDVRGNIKFSTIVYCFTLGATAYLMIDYLFDKFVSETIHFYIYIVSVRCVIELLSIIILSILFIEGNAKRFKTSAILIACALSSGFVFAQSLSQNLSALLVKVDIYRYGSSVGAILNLSESIKDSSENLLNVLPNTCFLEPLIFVTLSMILVDITANENWSLGKRTVTTLFTFLFCCLTYVLSAISTPFGILSVIYNVISLVFAILLFIRMVNSCVATERYE